MQHCSLWIFIWSIDLWSVWVLVKWLSLHWMVVICIGDGVFLIILTMLIGSSFCSEKSFRYRIGYLWTYKFNRTVGSKVVIISGSSERWDVSTGGSSTSHGREARWDIGIFPLETIWRVIVIGLEGDFRVFPLNKKIFTLNITVGLLLKFNNPFIKSAQSMSQ